MMDIMFGKECCNYCLYKLLVILLIIIIRVSFELAYKNEYGEEIIIIYKYILFTLLS